MLSSAMSALKVMFDGAQPLATDNRFFDGATHYSYCESAVEPLNFDPLNHLKFIPPHYQMLFIVRK